MAAFDPTEASKTYPALDTEELVRIAYLEPDYLPEARAVALRELDRRGVPKDRDDLIEQVRADIEFRHQSAEMLAYENLAKVNRVEQRITGVILIGVLWFFALMGPATLEGSSAWVTIALLVAWAVVAVYAIWKLRDGQSRLFYFVIVVPAALFLLGLTYRVSK